jgi:hypothetical protein
MHANDYRNITTAQALTAISDVLNLSEIPWGVGNLSEVRHNLSIALEKKEPGMARQAFHKLQGVVEQLALGVGGNAAYSLLVAYFSK